MFHPKSSASASSVAAASAQNLSQIAANTTSTVMLRRNLTAPYIRDKNQTRGRKCPTGAVALKQCHRGGADDVAFSQTWGCACFDHSIIEFRAPRYAGLRPRDGDAAWLRRPFARTSTGPVHIPVA
jgi:hypothetical protein